MHNQYLIFFLLFLCFLLKNSYQILPYYGASKYFYVNQANIVVWVDSGMFTIPSTFPISTASHRMPFYGFMAGSHLETYVNQYFFFLSQQSTFTSTTFTVTIYAWVVTTTGFPTEYYGFQPNSYLKFRYLLVLDTFPDKFMSISNLMNGLSYSIAANSDTQLTFSLSSWVTPPPITLSTTDTVFIYPLTYLQYGSTKTPLDSSFQLTLSYRAIDADNFAVKISTKYPVVVYRFQVRVFIYNKADFDNLYVKIYEQTLTFNNLPVGVGSNLLQTYIAPYIPASDSDIFFGINGFEFSMYQFMGFQFTIASTTGNNYDITLSNLWATSAIPRLDLLIVLPSQFRCPYLQLLIDQTLTTCYNISCPMTAYKSNKVLGLTEIYVCKPCNSTYTDCIECDSTKCIQCDTNYALASNSVSCISCSSYHQQCLTCNFSNCITCSLGYLANQTTCKQNLICGDGIWVNPFEQCDDGNFNDFDGCDSHCKVEKDYECLVTEKMPSGASDCKFTKNITLDIASVQKQPSSNKLHILLNLGPQTFKQWTQQSIKDLLGPIEVVDSTTGNLIQIPSDQINIVYHKNELTGQVQLVLDYGQNNLQGSQIKLNIKPDQTNLKALRDLSTQNDLLLKLNSQSNAFYMYDYSPEEYRTQNIVETLSLIVGITSLIFAFLGFFVPAGKLIVLETLSVVQMGYFSILSFEKIPPSFAGLQSLNVSNGYNNLNLFSSDSKVIQNIFLVMGIDNVAMQNYNISFLFFVMLPILIGLIGYLIKNTGTNRVYNQFNQFQRNTESSQDINVEQLQNQSDSQLIKQKQKQTSNLSKFIFKRIMYENTFYGLLFGGYLGWVSIIHSLSHPKLYDYIALMIMITTCLIYLALFIRSQNIRINLKDFNQKSKQKRTRKDQQFIKDSQKLEILTQFGQFGDAYRQLIPEANSNLMKKFYFFFIFQRLFNSLIITLVNNSINVTNPILIGIYTIQLIVMSVLYTFSKSNESQGKGSIFSYLYKNYVLRQSVNFLTIILIQLLYSSVKAIIDYKGPYEAFVHDTFVTKGVPYAVISLLLANVGFNVFCWIWEIRQDKLIQKTKIIWNIMFPKTQKTQMSLKKNEFQITIQDFN